MVNLVASKNIPDGHSICGDHIRGIRTDKFYGSMILTIQYHIRLGIISHIPELSSQTHVRIERPYGAM
jgi:hypothetical protein